MSGYVRGVTEPVPPDDVSASTTATSLLLGGINQVLCNYDYSIMTTTSVSLCALEMYFGSEC